MMMLRPWQRKIKQPQKPIGISAPILYSIPPWGVPPPLPSKSSLKESHQLMLGFGHQRDIISYSNSNAVALGIEPYNGSERSSSVSRALPSFCALPPPRDALHIYLRTPSVYEIMPVPIVPSAFMRPKSTTRCIPYKSLSSADLDLCQRECCTAQQRRNNKHNYTHYNDYDGDEEPWLSSSPSHHDKI
ncbi:hypothetical protein BCR41DRAFT_15637 [Lobosporangium transversale]|uniref:Uncharacterized protein n=1 Tax=Lobosporangium transversale TaxID=64571 RepID=A0A1Y2GTK5_9FUNG|nr:hypothetical protein BCR41DRAFT_15637 [Lobosporangium transversale]ORZ22816.1 hypothetical protein BCR41DRAFT_15637 [Lobosporangium transversale]|eukprot:XP_021883370.1 hypothetical protein BCR41DRAFT_15637 [Lobosporangium transversale]